MLTLVHAQEQPNRYRESLRMARKLRDGSKLVVLLAIKRVLVVTLSLNDALFVWARANPEMFRIAIREFRRFEIETGEEWTAEEVLNIEWLADTPNIRNPVQMSFAVKEPTSQQWFAGVGIVLDA